MSDAKAKAEARRAKILAREKNKTVSAITTEEDSLYLSIAETKGKERPLAARRSLIAAKEEEEGNEPVSPVPESKPLDPHEIEEHETLYIVPKETASNTMPSPVKKIKLPPPKTMEEIEREIAENTKKFDERVIGDEPSSSSKVVKKPDEKEAEKKEEKEGKEKTTSDEKEKPAEVKKEEQIKKFKAKTQTKYVIEQSAAMRFLRFFLILLIAGFIGFRIVQKNQAEALQRFQQVENSWELDEFDLDNKLESLNTQIHGSAGTVAQRTWLQFFQSKITGQFEGAVSAVMMIYWVSKMCTPLVDRMLKTPPQKKKSNPVQMVMDFLSTGLSSWMESVYTVLGETAFYFFVLLSSVVFFTIYYADTIKAQTYDETAASMANGENFQDVVTNTEL